MKTYSLIVGFAALVIGAAKVQAAELEVKPVGVQVVWDTLKEDFDGFGTLNAMENGVNVVFGLISDGRRVVNFDDDKSKIVSMTDSSGKVLTGEIGPFAKT